MKTFFKLSILLLVVSFYSCEKEEITEFDTTSNKRVVISNTLISNKTTTSNNNPRPYTDAEILENSLQWVSFLTAQAVLKDAPAYTQFIGELNNSTISLSQLLNLNHGNQDFRDAFETEYYIYQNPNQNNEPCAGGGRPRGVPTPNPCDPPCNTAVTPFSIYASRLLNDECIELYIPGQSFGITNGVVSTAHPMTKDSSNLAYEHFGECIVSEVTVGGNNSINSTNIIVARPDRQSQHIIGQSLNCSYSQYPFNFDNFLN